MSASPLPFVEFVNGTLRVFVAAAEAETGLMIPWSGMVNKGGPFSVELTKDNVVPPTQFPMNRETTEPVPIRDLIFWTNNDATFAGIYFHPCERRRHGDDCGWGFMIDTGKGASEFTLAFRRHEHEEVQVRCPISLWPEFEKAFNTAAQSWALVCKKF